MTLSGVMSFHLLGAAGCTTSHILSLSPWRTMQHARRQQSLGGLDTRVFGLFFAAHLFGLSYSIRQGDIWIFMATCGPTSLWLYFSLSALQLLGLEEGQLMPARRQVRDDLQTSANGGEGLVYQRTAPHRHRQMRRIALQIAGFFMFNGLLLFSSIPTIYEGFQDVELPEADWRGTQSMAHGMVLLIASFACFCAPLPNLYTLIKRQDASTIFLPLCLGQLLHNVLWTLFGLLKMDPALFVPHMFGGLTMIAQVLIRLVYGRKSDSSNHDQSVDVAIPGPELPKHEMTCATYEDYLIWQRQYAKLNNLSGAVAEREK